mgnify:CR=1 FL=1
MITKETTMLPEIAQFISSLSTDSITEERKEVLQPLKDFIQQKTTANSAIRINFICTHNSRRSHLSQVWAIAILVERRLPPYSQWLQRL